MAKPYPHWITDLLRLANDERKEGRHELRKRFSPSIHSPKLHEAARILFIRGYSLAEVRHELRHKFVGQAIPARSTLSTWRNAMGLQACLKGKRDNGK